MARRLLPTQVRSCKMCPALNFVGKTMDGEYCFVCKLLITGGHQHTIKIEQTEDSSESNQKWNFPPQCPLLDPDPMLQTPEDDDLIY